MFKNIINKLTNLHEPFANNTDKDIIIEEKQALIDDSKRHIDDYESQITQFERNFALAEEEFEEYSKSEEYLTQLQINMQKQKSEAIDALRVEKSDYIKSQTDIITQLDSEHKQLNSENTSLLDELLAQCKTDETYINSRETINNYMDELRLQSTDVEISKDSVQSHIDRINSSYEEKHKKLNDVEIEEENIIRTIFEKRRDEINQDKTTEYKEYQARYTGLQDKLDKLEEQITNKSDEIILLDENKVKTCYDENINDPNYIEKKKNKEAKKAELKKERQKLELRKLELQGNLDRLKFELEAIRLEYDNKLKLNLNRINEIRLRKQKFIGQIGDFNNLIGDMNIKLDMIDLEIKNYNKLKLNIAEIEKMHLNGINIESADLIWKFILSTFTADEIKKWKLPDTKNIDWDTLKDALSIVKTLNLKNMNNIMALRNKLKNELSRGKDINIGNIFSGKKLELPKNPKIDLNPKDDKGKIALEFEFRYSSVAIVIFSILILILLFIKFTRS